jgi:16S rRNA (cytidine1402-2'-O)-methyltransferase
MSSHRACLYVVATPIGNLADITRRALEVLAEVEVILSENVGKTRRLLSHYDIATRVMSYREENARRMDEVALGLLAGGKSVALVAEAGTPGVSDPGRQIVDAAWARGIKIVPIPGASAAIAAISVCGMRDARFVFEGFLPRRRSKRRQRLAELAGDQRQVVFFEAPHRIVECLEDIRDSLGDRTCLVAREITKLHEEIERLPVSRFIEKYSKAKPLGEFVIICEGRREAVTEGGYLDAAGAKGASAQGSAPTPGSAAGATHGATPGPAARSGRIPEVALTVALGLVKSGLRKKEVAKGIAREFGLKSSDVYDAICGAAAAAGGEKQSGLKMGKRGGSQSAKGERR